MHFQSNEKKSQYLIHTFVPCQLYNFFTWSIFNSVWTYHALKCLIKKKPIFSILPIYTITVILCLSLYFLQHAPKQPHAWWPTLMGIVRGIAPTMRLVWIDVYDFIYITCAYICIYTYIYISFTILLYTPILLFKNIHLHNTISRKYSTEYAFSYQSSSLWQYGQKTAKKLQLLGVMFKFFTNSELKKLSKSGKKITSNTYKHEHASACSVAGLLKEGNTYLVFFNVKPLSDEAQYTLKKCSLLKIENNSSWVDLAHFPEKTHLLSLELIFVSSSWRVYMYIKFNI